MKIIVTTCSKGQHLLFPGLELLKQFLGVKPRVDLAEPRETKAQQLLRITNNFSEEYFILIEEDFYLVKQVNIELLKELFCGCRIYKVDRFSLQSKNCHSYSDWKELPNKFQGREVYQTVPEVQVPFSLEVSIWRRDFLREWLVWFMDNHYDTSQDDGQIEMKISDHLRSKNVPTKIYALDEIVINYRDMMRGGKEEIKLLHNPLRMVIKPGNELALHPRGDSKELELCL